jgi:sulfite reductase beta subunit-like hemoprotein
VKVPGGRITADQLAKVAELSAKYGRGRLEITNRQSMQLHWIGAEDALEIFSVMEGLGLTTDMCGQGFGGARYGDARNIVCCPASGIAGNEILDGSSLMRELTELFVGNPDFLDMPRKFKFSISGCGLDCVRAVTNDLALAGVVREGEPGFTPLVGGSVGSSLPGPRLAKPVGVFVEEKDAYDVAVATIEIHRDYGNRESKAKARFKWLIENWGLEKFLDKLEEKLGKTLERYDGPAFVERGDHSGVQPQSQPGYYYLNVPLLGGRLSSDQALAIANLAGEFGNGDLRLTPTQNITIANVREKDALLEKLEENGFSFSGSRLRWTSMGCASDFCGKTQSPHAKEILKETIEHLEGRFGAETLDGAGFRIHISGCPHNCCANQIAEIGLGGRLTKEGETREQTYDVYLGGRSGPEPRFGRVAGEKVPAGELKNELESLLVSYLERRDPSEDLGEFCNRREKTELESFLRPTGG